MAFRAFRFLRDMLDLDETSKTAGNVIAVNDTEDGYELVSPAAAAGGAPSDAKYIVQQANGDLSAEQALGALSTGILKNTTTTGVLSIATEGTDYYKPGGTDVALGDGGTGASTASGARTNLGLVIGTDVPSQSSFADHSARHENGGADEISLAGLDGTPTALQTHLDDTTAAHAASSISIADAGNDFTATDVEGALAELQSDAETDAAALTTHAADTTSVHGITDTSALYAAGGTDVALADGGTGASLTDPGADRILFWDDSAGAITFLEASTGLTITGTAMTASGASGSGLFDAYALLRNEQAAGSNGGTATSGSWIALVLNTESFDPAGMVSLSSNQVTLGAGTYSVRARQTFRGASVVKLRLRNVTDSTTAVVGMSAYTTTTDVGNQLTELFGRFTIAGTKTFELQYRVFSTSSTTGLGTALDLGEVEVFTELEIWREA
jgi:hypothetical protein